MHKAFSLLSLVKIVGGKEDLRKRSNACLAHFLVIFSGPFLTFKLGKF